MNTKILSFNLVRLLVIAALVMGQTFSRTYAAEPQNLAVMPTALPGGPYVVLAGQPITIIGTGTDPSGESLTFAWDIDFDGTFETAGDTAVITDTAGQNREVPIGFRACNTSGFCGTAQTFLKVRNSGQVWVLGPEPLQDIGMPSSEIGIPDGPMPAVIEGFGEVIDVVGSENLLVALRANGTVWTMGTNFYGQLGNPSLPTGWLPDGRPAHSSEPVQAEISNVVAIASNGEHVLALKRDGTVWAWGSNRYLTLGNGAADWNAHPLPTKVENVSGVIAISASQRNSFALTRTGGIYGWGSGDQIYGRACDTTFPCRITTIPQAVALQVTPDWAIVLKRDGTVWFWGGYDPVTLEDRLDPEQIMGFSGITALSAAGGSFLALKNDGTAWGFGKNGNGQLGFNPWPPYPKYERDYIGPVQIPGLAGTRALAAGDALQMALLQDGTVASWGLVVISCPEGCGEYWVPSPLAGLTNVQSIAVGNDFKLAIVPGVPTAPYLAITQIADQESVSSGDPIGFTITVTNNGDGISSSVTLTDTLPTDPGLSWSVSGTDATSCSMTAGILSCDFGNMSPGAVKIIRLTSPTPISLDKPSCPIVSNTATVRGEDPLEDRSATASIQVLCPRVSITIWPDTPSVAAGDPISYTVTLGNIGEGVARDVDAQVGLPNNPGLNWSITNVTPASAAGNCSLDTSGTSPELVCLFDQMAAGQEVTITISSPTSTGSCGILASGGSVTSSNSEWQRAKVAQIVVNCPVTAPDLAISQTADHAAVSTGDPLGFTITITNNGSATANSVTLSDTLPIYPELSWSIGGTDAAACTITDGLVSCNFGDLPPSAVKTIRLTSPTRYETGPGFCPTISSVATVRAGDPEEVRNSTASIQVLCPEVYLFVGSISNDSATAGDPITYIVTLDNIGEGIARDVDAHAGLPNNPGLRWTITNVNPASAAGNCSLDTSGTVPLLLCLLDEVAAGQAVRITVSSPTTSRSCGELSSSGGVRPSNGEVRKAKVWDISVSCTVSKTVKPGEAETMTLLDGRGQTEFPANLVSEPTTFTYTEQDAPSQDLDSNAFAGLSFTLDATDLAGNPVTSFPASYTMQLNYQDSDWQSAGIADESLLNLAYWDIAINQWVNVLPCGRCSLDTEQNQLVASLDHLTEFALVGPTDITPPVISAQPQNQTVYVGAPASFSAAASGTPAPGLQWQVSYDGGLSWTDVVGATASPLTFTSGLEQNGNQYRAVFTNSAGSAATDAATLTVTKRPATVALTNLTQTYDGQPKPVTVITDPAGLSALVTYDGSTDAPAAAGSYAVMAMVNDASYEGSVSGTLTILPASLNTAPTANPGGPYLAAINTAISFDGSGSSDPDGDPLTYSWTFGDGATGTGATAVHTYTAAGIYNTCLTVSDGALNSNAACTLAVVYDPSAGFVTGGGWINSPAGAYKADASLTGQATFGFVSKYKKGATAPTGTTQFQFSVAGLSFYSDTYEWLVVNQGGKNAQFKGSGLINGEADPNGNAYKFMLWAGDGKSTNSSDTFQIRIWWEDAAGVEHDVYDNGVAQAIGGGNIVVHTGK